MILHYSAYGKSIISFIFKLLFGLVIVQKYSQFILYLFHRQTLWKRIQAVVTPLLAQLVSVIDRDCNLDLLLDSNSGEEVRNLWLKIFGSNEMLDIPNVDLK